MPPDTLTIAPSTPASRAPVEVLDLSIVIVNWNTQHVIVDCLESVLANPGDKGGGALGAAAQATRTLGAEAPLEAVIKAGLKELSA